MVYRQVYSDSGLKAYTMRRAWSWWRLSLLRSHAQGSFGSIAGKGTDLKGKRLSNPHRFFCKPIVNVKGMTVISHRLCPVPINKWTVLRTVHADLYLLVHHACIFTLCQAKGTCVIQYYSYFSMIIKWKWIDNITWLFMLSLASHMLLLLLTFTSMMKVCPSWPSSEDLS
jgi:hypothetical protein